MHEFKQSDAQINKNDYLVQKKNTKLNNVERNSKVEKL